MNLYLLLGSGASALALLAGAYGLGHHNASKADAIKAAAQLAAQVSADNQALAARIAQDNANANAAQTAEQEREKTLADQQVVYRTITQKVTQYVHDHPDTTACGVDADGLRLWNAANSGADSAAPAGDHNSAPGPPTVPAATGGK